MIDLSIIILNYNNSKLLKNCLESVKQTTLKISYETIVIDNASTDDSVQMVKDNFPEATIIENKENLGFTKANNKGIAIARGRYVMLLNDDTIVKESAFDKLIEFMDANPTAGACGPKILNTDNTPQRQGSILGPRFWESNYPKEVGFLTGACLVVKREALNKAGPLDENLFFYNDDLDWCKRIKKAGFKIFFMPLAQVIHYGGYSTGKTFNSRIFIEGFRGGLYFCKKHYGMLVFNLYRFALLMLFPIALTGLTIFSALRFFKEYPQKLKAYFEILKITFFGPIESPL